MKVLVNAVSISEGGSLVVLSRLLAAMVAQRPDIEWHAAVHPEVARRSDLPKTVTRWTSPWAGNSAAHVVFWYEFALPRLARRLNADVLFSQTNYLPRRALACPTLLLVQHAGHFSPEFGHLMEQHLRTRASIMAWRRKSAWVRSSVRAANRVTVQTLSLATAIQAEAHVPLERIDIVPHGPGMFAEPDRAGPRRSGRWRIGYVSKFGVQKDFATALRAHRELLDRGHEATLILTLDTAEPSVAAVERLMDDLGLRSSVENHGEVSLEAVRSLYHGLDLFVFPSRCESFGFPLVEAMAYGLPVVAARTASNAEVAGPGAPMFSPGDWRGLADVVESLMSAPAEHEAQSRRSLAAARRFSWDRAASGTLAAIDRVAATLQTRTARHYDAYPFDFLTADDEARIEAWQPRPFRRFVETYVERGDSIAEVGCGPGRGTLYLANRGLRVTAVDLSFGSLQLARRRAPDAMCVAATNLALPFADASFDAVVSDGVIHHTAEPRRALLENARILKPGGHLYLALYNRRGHYRYLYTYAGVPVRWLDKRRWGHRLIRATLLPTYYLVHLAKSRGKRTWRGAEHFFYDYIMTPRASFHAKDEIERWARAERLSLLDYDPNVGNVHAFVFRKDGASLRRAR